jgi:16S rRNA C967 or C1407 C5-methylase (RsmB/RsmF family)
MLDVSKMIKGTLEPQERQLLRRRSCSDGSAISRPQDLVIAAPNSSNFDLIREAPDYLLHFKKEGMDELFAKEKAMLEGTKRSSWRSMACFIYMIYTISKKEGHQTVTEFLLAHPEFKIGPKEAQLFPYEELDTALYYCRDEERNAAREGRAPLGEL